MADTSIGKKAESKIRSWLSKPEEGISFDRLPDQLSGYYGSKNICDFICFKSPYMYYIESKATEQDRFDLSMISDYQYYHLLEKSMIKNVFGLVVILFATQKRAFIVDIREIEKLKSSGIKSFNIKKILSWDFKYVEIPTVPSRKELLDYTGDINELVQGVDKRNED